MNYFFKALIKGELKKTCKYETYLNQLPDKAKRYHEIEQSEKLKEFRTLEILIGTDIFQTKKHEMKKKDYAKTEEAQQEKRLKSLRKDADILFFQQTDAAEIKEVDRRQEVYRDDFNWTSLSSSDWKSGFAYPTAAFKANHSFVEDNQAYNNGKNIRTSDSVLHIVTRKEYSNAPAWDTTKGMVMQDFAFTSDVINNAEKLELTEGCAIQVKVRSTGRLSHSITLRSKKQLPMISLYECNNKKVYCGMKTMQENKMHQIEGLKGKWNMIYTLVWEDGKLTWFVNNMQIHTERCILPAGEKLYMHLASAVHKSNKKAGAGEMQIDWIRVNKLN